MSEIDLSKLPDSPKLHRAAVLSEESIEMTKAWLASGAGVVQKNHVPGAVGYEFHVAPAELRVVLGDCFQNIRAALDHEVFALSARRHGRAWADAADTAFPVANSEQSFRSRGRQQIRGLSRAAQDLVEQLQPYRDQRHPLSKSLELAHDVARIDRHRLLSLSAAQPRSYELNQTTMRANLAVSLLFVMDEKFGGTDALAASRGHASWPRRGQSTIFGRLTPHRIEGDDLEGRGHGRLVNQVPRWRVATSPLQGPDPTVRALAAA